MLIAFYIQCKYCAAKIKNAINHLRIEIVVSVLFTNSARAASTIDEKFSILHKAAEAKCNIENFRLILHSVSALFIKANTLKQSLTRLIYDQRSLLALI